MAIHDLQRRIQRLYLRDQWIAVLLVFALLITLFVVYRATEQFASGTVRGVLAVSGTLLVIFNAASIWALVRHNREDKTFIYSLDIKHLDEYRLARTVGKNKGQGPDEHDGPQAAR